MRGFRVAVLAVLGLFVVDALVLDVFPDLCPDTVEDCGVCHGCPCGPHLITTSDAAVRADVRPTEFSPFVPKVVVRLLPKAVFHPPKASV